jgi:hypothetical protein
MSWRDLLNSEDLAHPKEISKLIIMNAKIASELMLIFVGINSDAIANIS